MAGAGPRPSSPARPSSPPRGSSPATLSATLAGAAFFARQRRLGRHRRRLGLGRLLRCSGSGHDFLWERAPDCSGRSGASQRKGCRRCSRPAPRPRAGCGGRRRVDLAPGPTPARRYDPGVPFEPVAASRPGRARGVGAHAVGHRRRVRREPAPAQRRPGVGLLRGPAHRQRPARHPPRVGPAVQGPLPPVPHHAGAPRGPEGRLGLPRPPGRGRGREGARHPQQARDRGVRHRRVQPPVPRIGAALRGRLRVAHQAHRDVARHRRRLLDARQLVHRERVVAVPPDVGRRRHLRGPQGGALLRALRHRAVEPRARPTGRLPGHHRPVGLRALPGRRPRLRPPRVDDHPLDAGVERRRRGRARGRVRAGPERPAGATS